MNIFSKIICGISIALSAQSIADTTTYGKIVGIETRAWGLHIQTDFSFAMAGCEAVAGKTYMYDFVYSNYMNSTADAKVEASIILSAFAANKDIAFHIYDCNGVRPRVGYILIR